MAQPTENPSLKADSSLLRGITVKLDIGNTAYQLLASGGKNNNYEAALQVNLLNKYLPTVEVGYGNNQQLSTAGARYQGDGLFMRLGSDFNIMKKKSDNMFLLGLRVAGGYQNYSLAGIQINNDYWNPTSKKDYNNLAEWNYWGELVVGVQVYLFHGFHMGWAVRGKVLFTRVKEGEVYPYVIPGYGRKSETGFGFNYYIGYTF